MKTAIVYYSKHHGNTKKLLDAIAEQDNVLLIDATDNISVNLSEFDCIGFASGIYFASFAKQVLEYAERNLPERKDVFFTNTCGVAKEHPDENDINYAIEFYHRVKAEFESSRPR